MFVLFVWLMVIVNCKIWLLWWVWIIVDLNINFLSEKWIYFILCLVLIIIVVFFVFVVCEFVMKLREFMFGMWFIGV